MKSAIGQERGNEISYDGFVSCQPNEGSPSYQIGANESGASMNKISPLSLIHSRHFFKPRVALFSGNYNYLRDGANRALNRLVDYLGRQGVAVRVYSPTGDVPAFQHAGDLVSVPSFAIPRRKEYRFAMGLPKAVRDDIAAFQPNIFHLSAPDLLGYKALKLAKSWGIPVVASVHTRFETYLRYYGLAWAEKYATRYLRSFYNQCEQIYPPTDSMAQVLRAERMCNDIRIWGRGIDGNLFHPSKRDQDWRSAHGIAPDDVAVAFVGRLVLEKGLDTFADTIELLKARGVAHKVVVIGDGPERARFQGRLPEAVFTGFLGDEALAKAYASSDLFFNPSSTETFGNVTLEAMAAGIPPVCARATGSMSLVNHGVSGFLADGAAEEYAGYIAYLAGNAQMRAAFAAAGRERALLHNWDNILQGVLLNYCDVLGAQPAVSPVSRGNLSPAAAL